MDLEVQLMKLYNYFLCAVLLLCCHVYADVLHDPASSYPYLSGHTFRACCQHAVNNSRSSFKPESVQDGDAIFVCGDHLRHFFNKYHPHIQARYILVTHDTIYSSPGGYSKYLNDDKLVLWFGKNNSLPGHPKMVSIPIGLANNHWGHGKTHLFDQVISDVAQGKVIKDKLLYMNFLKSTYRSERDHVYNLFKDTPFCTISSKKPTLNYLYDLASSQFVLSPRGAGVDCHRTWETLLMGSYPIIKSSFLDSLFEGLPVVIIKDWNCITPEFLAEKFAEFSAQEWNRERLFAPYWVDIIANAQDAVRNGQL